MWYRHKYCAEMMSKILLVICGVMVSARASSDELQLPLSPLQLHRLAEDVCNEMFMFERENVTQKTEKCIKYFDRSAYDVSRYPSKLEFLCQTPSNAMFNLPTLETKQLVLLIPKKKNGMLNYKLIYNSKDIYQINTEPPSNYTFWYTGLSRAGAPMAWQRGPDLPVWKSNQKENNVTIDEPKYNYEHGELTATFHLIYSGGDNPCAEFKVRHICQHPPLGMINEIIVKGNEPVVVNGLRMADNCTLKVHDAAIDKHYSFVYNTPSCEELPACKPGPEKVQNVYIEAFEANSGSWDVYVNWTRQKREPEFYNVTVRADNVISECVPGNTTEVKLSNVVGTGLYNVTIESIYSNSTHSKFKKAIFPVRSTHVIMVVIWCAVLLTATALIGSAVWWKRSRNNSLRHYIQGIDEKLAKEFDPDTGPESGVEDSWEIRSDRLLLHEVIGEGAFGVVRRGTLTPGGKEVAVKMLKDFPTLEEHRSFRAEMELMKSVGAHPHVVSLVGCCSGRRPLIIAEYCSKGDLLSYLRCSWDVMVSKRNAKYYNNNLEGSDYRNNMMKSKLQKEHLKLVVNKLYDLHGVCDTELTSLDLLSFCRQIAKGMEFLASNRVVHRDLAARNILVTADRTLKIADFGLSRDVYTENQYKQKGNGMMPVKWMALESLTRRVYTTQSDVWSFGVVIWEIVTVGGAPYPEVPAARLPRLLRAGYRMPRPNNCSKQLYEVMMSCWRARPRDRPTFAELHKMLDDLLNNACADEYLSLEFECDDPPPAPKPQSYFKMILRGNRVWTRGESYERPKVPQSNYYTSTPAPAAKPQAV